MMVCYVKITYFNTRKIMFWI